MTNKVKTAKKRKFKEGDRRRRATDPVDAKEKTRRAAISNSLRSSKKQKAYHDRLRGVPRGPEPIDTRARKAASKKAVPGTKAWDVYFKQAKERLTMGLKHEKERRRALAG